MITIYATNVNDAWPQAIELINKSGVPEPSRAGPVRRVSSPVMTVYSKPWQRVLFDPARDANPIFHLHEALWMLAGRDDATWLDQFVSDFSARFAEPDGIQHGAYGRRWRNHFISLTTILPDGTMDQLDTVVEMLRRDPTTRQAVIQMWDAECDLDQPQLKDKPCNTQIYLTFDPAYHLLDMGVMCRSNDIVWGCYGANAVHFSILQEYLAARLGTGIGRLYQFSWNWHMYENTKHLADWWSADGASQQPYPKSDPLVNDSESFDLEVRAYVQEPAFAGYQDEEFQNTFLTKTAWPMFMANVERKAGNTTTSAMAWAEKIASPDWRLATLSWLQRRKK